MESYQRQKSDLLRICQTLSAWIDDAGTLPGVSKDALSEWQRTCREIEKHLSTETIRVAVVGAIKSGKSTFVNSLFMGDYLMRGAGVITSIVTRIRKGTALRATLHFKSWDEINTEISGALVLFPSFEGRLENDRFDIRRKQERLTLQKRLSDLNADQWISNDTRNINSVLLASYVNGYDTVKDIIGTDTVTRHYSDNTFPEHRKFVGNDALAVYLRDIELEINTGNLDSDIEIADCQGSDSSNPLHLAMIQDYLLRTHFIVYVISSRTGLRQGDIKFLTMIKRMGILDNALFVVNCDFSEHESVDGLNRLVDRVREELSLIKTAPEIYTLSALYNLFRIQKHTLSQKDHRRFDQWEREDQFVAVSGTSSERFESAFRKQVVEDRAALLIINNLERLDVATSAMNHWVRVQAEVFTRDTKSADRIINKISHHQVRMNKIKSVIRSTLDGAVQKAKNELKVEIDQYFDVRYGDILSDIIDVIHGFKVSTADFKERIDTVGFSNTLYGLYQEFKQVLDIFMTETINPQIIRFIRSSENRIKEQLESVSAPFVSMAKEALVEYNSNMSEFGIFIEPESRDQIKLQDMDAIKTMAGLSLPPAAAVMHYTARIRTEATLRFGFYAMAKILKRLLKKPIQDSREEAILALRDGIARMKKETEKSVISHFKDYKENLKFQYLFRLVDAVSSALYEILNDQFRASDTDLANMVERVSNRQIDRHQIASILKSMAETTHHVEEMIQDLRAQIAD